MLQFADRSDISGNEEISGSEQEPLVGRTERALVLTPAAVCFRIGWPGCGFRGAMRGLIREVLALEKGGAIDCASFEQDQGRCGGPAQLFQAFASRPESRAGGVKTFLLLSRDLVAKEQTFFAQKTAPVHFRTDVDHFEIAGAF